MKIIQGRRELASLCAHVAPIPGLDIAALIQFFDLWLKIHDIEKVLSEAPPFDPDADFESFDLAEITDLHELKKKVVLEMVKTIAPETFAALYALFYFQREEQFSEIFERTLTLATKRTKQYGQNPAQYADNSRHLLEKTAALPEILNSLNYLGQTALLNAVVEHYHLEAHKERLLQPSMAARSRLLASVK